MESWWNNKSNETKISRTHEDSSVGAEGFRVYDEENRRGQQ